MSQRVYYSVTAYSPVMAVIQRALNAMRQFHQAADALQKELGAKTLWTRGNVRVCGAVFPGDLPEGWRQGPAYALPDKRSAAGKEWDRRLKSLPRGIDPMDFAAMMTTALNAEYAYHDVEASRMCWTTFERYGEVYVLSVPAACRVNPPGCVELKMSEYWKLKESIQEGVPA